MTKPSRKQLEKLISEYSQKVKLEHRLYKGYHPSTGQTGWYWTPFGEYSRFLGKTLAEAIEVLNDRLSS